ncbi:MurR/RpiR family transcriptional regulator [Acidovorax sp. CCYZU-2555]|uniref:MurR/RpiR family transcriptional regulator n=1 Tax=Acidovorax sp. CCYZU-2555 TaxID=2835042 RepID=UPI001BD10E53|nr:MurR/RpiR family transcriptional regulator [Acidovorax sp. CCYZU-2555]MBS7779141.1 MurR/RpiR family transcriptional regulator [Acidovorax sp. CCYZU-2555]
MEEQSAIPLDARIREVYADLSAAERKLADVVLARQQDLRGYSATELAALADTSKSSAARFFRRLGYAGFDEFRLQVRSRATGHSPLARLAQAPAQPGDDGLQAHARRDAQRLLDWSEELRDEDVQAALAQLARARGIGVLGYRHSQVTAQYASLLFDQVRPDVQLLATGGGREAEALAGLGAKDLLFVVDFRRRSAQLARVLAAARAVGIPLVVLSDAAPGEWLETTAQADVVLRCARAAAHQPPELTPLFDTYVCGISLVNFLATALAARLRASAQARLTRIEHLHAALGDLQTPN